MEQKQNQPGYSQLGISNAKQTLFHRFMDLLKQEDISRWRIPSPTRYMSSIPG